MRKLMAASSLALAGLLLIGCNDYPKGPSGKVVDNHRYYIKPMWHYKITTENNGKKTEFKVNSDNYYKCPRGAQYPKCLNKK